MSLRFVRYLFLKDNYFWFKEPNISHELSINLRKETYIPYIYMDDATLKRAIVSTLYPKYGRNLLILDLSVYPIKLFAREILDFHERISENKLFKVVLYAEEGEVSGDINVYRLEDRGEFFLRELPSFSNFYVSKLRWNVKSLLAKLVQKHDIRDKSSFFRTFTYLLEANGKELHFRKATEELDIRFETLRSFLNYFEQAFLFKVVESREPTPRSPRKLIFCDWRAYSYAMGYTSKELLLEDMSASAMLSYNYLKHRIEGKEFYIS